MKLSIALAGLAVTAFAPAVARADAPTAPVVAPSSLYFLAWPHPPPAKGGMIDNTHSYWVPKATLRIIGPLASGTNVSIDYTLPGGKKWFSQDFGTLSADFPAGGWLDLDSNPNDLPAEDVTQATGEFGFKIVMKNALSGGAPTTLMAGKLEVKKTRAYPDNNTAGYKDQYDYYIDYDWALPIGYVQTDHWRKGSTWERLAATLDAYFWFRSDGSDQGVTQAFLFFGDKQIASMPNAVPSHEVVTASSASAKYRWELYRFPFPNTIASDPGHKYDASTFVLDQHPGDYTVKVLRNNKLARTLKFTIGADGKIADPFGSYPINTDRTLLPAAVLNDTDGKVDNQAWKKGMYFGNPVPGFTAQ